MLYITMRGFVALPVLIVILITAVLLGVIYYVYFNKPKLIISNFDDCAKAGNPIMQTYPAQCQTKDGRTFTQSTQTTNPTPSVTEDSGQKIPSYDNSSTSSGDYWTEERLENAKPAMPYLDSGNR